MTHASPVSLSDHGLPDSAPGFLAQNGLAGAVLKGFVPDASPRRYFRVSGQDALLMDDRQDPEGFAAFLQISKHLNSLGLSAPRVKSARPEDCLALIEDFGDATYARCLAQGMDEHTLYKLAVDVLLKLHHDPSGRHIERPVYDLAVQLDELSIFSHWFAPAVTPGLDAAAFDRSFRLQWRDALAPVADRHETLVLRDFHIDNLMLLEGREGEARCGLLDFQDAILGPSEYDLLSLLQDARRDLAEGLEESLLTYYCDHAPISLGNADFIRKRYAILGAQRHARILGVFVRLFQRDAKPRYLEFIPRVLSQFQAALKDAGLKDLSDFLDAALPDWRQTAATLHETLNQKDGSPNG